MTHLRSRWTALFLALVLSLSLALPPPPHRRTGPRPPMRPPSTPCSMAAPSVSSTPFGRTERSPSRARRRLLQTENRALTDDDLYGIGSISKTYTAAAMMKLVEQGIKAKDIVTMKSFENAIMVHVAISGSTNATMHIPAIAHEFGFEIDADTFDPALWTTGISFQQYDDYPAISTALSAGEVDAFCVDKSILAIYKTDGRSYIDDKFSPQEYGVATTKGPASLHTWMTGTGMAGRRYH